MKKYLKKEFMETCKTDIEYICGEVYSLLPEVEDWQLEKSVIFGEDRKILSQLINDDNGNKIGYKIDIDIMSDRLYNYEFISLEDIISLTKSYVVDDIHIIESKSVSMEDGLIIRKCSCASEEKEVSFKELYNPMTGCVRHVTNLDIGDEYFCFDLSEIFDEIKDKFENRCVSMQRKRD